MEVLIFVFARKISKKRMEKFHLFSEGGDSIP